MQPSQYIAIGSIGFTKEDRAIEDETWELLKSKPWHSLYSLLYPEPGTDALAGQVPALRRARGFQACVDLVEGQWAYMEIGISPRDLTSGILRVYLLPDDVERALVDRSSPKLWARRRQIISQLDFSSEAWNHERHPSPGSGPTIIKRKDAAEEEPSSLLELFNQMPSPAPDATSLKDPHARRQANNILQGKIPGLLADLHPHQRRSVVTMLLKECQPGKMEDPRLQAVRCPDGSAIYLDSVSGEVCLEQRWYDEVRGGILAEEMGSGKTLICLALILATLDTPSVPPELYQPEVPIRERVGSLCDMAASCATRHSVPWKSYFGKNSEFESITSSNVFKRNPGYYLVPPPAPRRSLRLSSSSVYVQPPKTMYLSTTSLVIVPNNLLAQWQDEIRKHTTGVKVFTIKKDDTIPSHQKLMEYDIVLMSQARFEAIVRDFEVGDSPLGSVQFKRCIVDEGHILGNSSTTRRSNLLIGLDSMSFTARWSVTGTPSKGLYGLDTEGGSQPSAAGELDKSLLEMEKKDLERIGAIAVCYLQARPWAKLANQFADNAEWATYLMLPRHRRRGHGRWDCLKATLSSLIVRHQIKEVQHLLPSINEQVVMLDGSYQDDLSVNIFSMMIIFNAVQSERTDLDYFFHPKQRKNLLLMVYNLKQTSFFGGSFFSKEEIQKSVETAEEFLQKKKVIVSARDEALLREAIDFGHLVLENELREQANIFHEVPVCVTGFPTGFGYAWSLDGREGDTICTSSSMLHSLQKRIFKAACRIEDFNSLLNGGLIEEGLIERDKHMESASAATKNSKKKKDGKDTMAGNAKIGQDSPRKTGMRSSKASSKEEAQPQTMSDEVDLSPLMTTRITSTVSAKLSYLIDSLLYYQEEEKIIIFYENDNIAWYLAGMLDVLQIQHLIYAKGLTVERRAQYVSTFHYNPSFRVLLMDLSQAAFGLDMRIASRIYFINPVLNPQVQAQAIGRVRRISQQKPVSVETLVLRGSIDEVLLDQQQHMTQADHRRAKSILDIQPIYNWIKNARISHLDPADPDPESQMAALGMPLPVFGEGFGRTINPNDGLVMGDYGSKTNGHGGQPSHAASPVRPVSNLEGRINEIQRTEELNYSQGGSTMKRTHGMGPGGDVVVSGEASGGAEQVLASRPARRVRFAGDLDDSS